MIDLNLKFPKLKKGMKLHIGPLESYIYDKIGKRNFDKVILNLDAANIFKLCDGENSINNIIKNIADKYEENIDNMKQVIVDIFELYGDYIDYVDFDEEKSDKIFITGG